jgi:CheY-like chemotaxis protein
MRDVRILVVEDEDRWLNVLRQELSKNLCPNVEIEWTKSYQEALAKVQRTRYDLVSVDLELLGEINSPTNFNLPGMELLKECRGSKRNRACGLMIFSGKATPGAVSDALKTFGANEFLDKTDYGDGGPYINAAQRSIRQARLQDARWRLADRYRLTFTYSQSSLIHAQLAGPSQGAESAEIINPPPVDLEDLARRADELNRRLHSDEEGAWKSEARSIGNAVYQTISTQRQILGLLTTSRALASSREDSALSLHFSGPPSGLSVPYELLREDGDYLALTHILTRRLSQGGPRVSHKSDPFLRFIDKRAEAGERLRVLIVGANTDGNIPAVEEEASRLAASISANLKLLGITPEITPLLGDDVTFSRVKDAIRDGQDIFHFAGHGNFNESVPEQSPLSLKDRVLTAADLKSLTEGTDLQFIFLSCCLAARTSGRVGRGDFHGFLHALSLADVPATLAYRWEVRDDSAIKFATEFYDSLWRNFCFGQSLLDSRREMAFGVEGRDNETWASPVLLSQTT